MTKRNNPAHMSDFERTPKLLPARAKVSLARERAANGSKGGRPGTFSQPHKAADAAIRLAKGETIGEVAEQAGCSYGAVHRFKQNHETMIAEMQEQIRLEAAEMVLAENRASLRALLDSTQDSSNRGQAQAGKLAYELAGVITGNGVRVHVGDVHQSLTINSDSAIDYDADEYARMRDSMGL